MWKRRLQRFVEELKSDYYEEDLIRDLIDEIESNENAAYEQGKTDGEDCANDDSYDDGYNAGRADAEADMEVED